MHAAAARGELLEVRQLAFVHPSLDEPRVHPVEAENDELLTESFSWTARPARRCGDANDEPAEQESFHEREEEEEL